MDKTGKVEGKCRCVWGEKRGQRGKLSPLFFASALRPSSCRITPNLLEASTFTFETFNVSILELSSSRSELELKGLTLHDDDFKTGKVQNE